MFVGWVGWVCKEREEENDQANSTSIPLLYRPSYLSFLEESEIGSKRLSAGQGRGAGEDELWKGLCLRGMEGVMMVHKDGGSSSRGRPFIASIGRVNCMSCE